MQARILTLSNNRSQLIFSTLREVVHQNCIKTLWNVCYLTSMVSASMLLYDRLSAHITDGDSFTDTDVEFIALYFVPAIVIFTVIIALTLVAVTTDSHQFLPPMVADRDSKLSMYLSLVLLWIVVAISLFFLPLIVACSVYIAAGGIDAVGLSIQAITMFMQLCYHMYYLQTYGYYSLLIVLCSILYFVIGAMGAVLQKREILPVALLFLWEMFMFFTMLMVTLDVKYVDNTVLIVCIVAAVNYVLFNIPLSKGRLLAYWDDSIAPHRYYQFIAESEQQQDRMYCLLHQLSHEQEHDGYGDGGVHLVAQDSLDDMLERVALLSPTSNDEEEDLTHTTHTMNSMLCYKLQRVYLTSDARAKQQIIRHLHPNHKRYRRFKMLLIANFIGSLIAFLFPLIWFFYVWIDLNMFGDGTVIASGKEVNANNLYVWMICSFYCITALLIAISIGGWPEMQLLRKWKIVLFVMSLKKHNIRDLEKAKHLFDRQETMTVILQLEVVQIDLAYLILSYLYGADDA